MRDHRTYLSVCSGYGGLDLAVEAITGAEMIAYAEINPASSKIMAARWPGVPNLGDVSRIDWAQHTGVHAIAAGFPCQDISNAGTRKGITGERSGLWSHVAKAVRIVRPRLVFLENVAAIKGRGLDVVAQDLAAIGYDMRWTCVRASDGGAPHHRDRWFAVAYPAGSVPDSEGVGRTARWAESAEQQGEVRRSPGSRGQLSADSDCSRLEIRSFEPAREECPAIVGSGVGAENSDGSAGSERISTASGQAESGGARADSR